MKRRTCLQLGAAWPGLFLSGWLVPEPVWSKLAAHLPQPRPQAGHAARRECGRPGASSSASASLSPNAVRPDEKTLGNPASLSPAQSRTFRAWMVRLIAAQFASGPSLRWQQRDCVGLVRFVVAEALRGHDLNWKRANGLNGQPVPPELDLLPSQQGLRHNWRLPDGSRSAWVSALELVQENTRFRGKDCNLAQPGDLLFFDQGEQQHLMVWMGSYIAYHTGTVAASDNGLRAMSLPELQRWPDTRWHPVQDNPNFAGVYRFHFLSA
jgi:uncharacterized protein YfaT (DUF1175 family)